ncbi:MAG TPA: radical SAM mobile pair protein B [Candidatus Alistipes faecigallinarum]|nr:radical SAM mobile pair protein B [Candidatus Alistipes faecigallinarum]
MEQELIRDIDVQSVMTKSSLPVGGYSVNPYVGCPHACKYCYASFMKRFTGHTEPWGSFLDVKHWKSIGDPHRFDGQRIVIGSVTDGYNPFEEHFQRTRHLLEELRGTTAEIMICTKSDLVLRDLDLLREFQRVTVSWSVNTLDEAFRADMDRAVSIGRRFEAMRQVYEAGIRTVCFVSPIFPGITDPKAIIERVRDFTDLVWLENLNLRGSFKAAILAYIREKRPELVPLYEEIYNHRRTDYWQALEHEMAAYAAANGLPYRVNDLPYGRSEKGRPVVVNYFYHEKIRLKPGHSD